MEQASEQVTKNKGKYKSRREISQRKKKKKKKKKKIIALIRVESLAYWPSVIDFISSFMFKDMIEIFEKK